MPEQSREAEWFQEMLNEIEGDPDANMYSFLYKLAEEVCVVETDVETIAEKTGVPVVTVRKFFKSWDMRLLDVFKIVNGMGLKINIKVTPIQSDEQEE